MKLQRHSFAIAAGFVGLLASVPAMAASDYLLKLEDVTGASSNTIELASWSFGASNPTSVGSSGMSSGKRQHQPVIRFNEPLSENGHVSVVTAREAGSGMATGRRSCATGKHFPTAVLKSPNMSWVLVDVTISTCDIDGMQLTYKAVR